MRNICRDVTDERRGEILSMYMRKLERSGYSESVRRNVALSGVRGYLRMVKEEEEGGRRVNRPRQDGEEERRFKKLAGKSNWFRSPAKKAVSNRKLNRRRMPSKRTKVKTVDTVMFVPHTPGGELAKRLQEAEDRFVKNRSGGRVKFVERGGSALRDVLCNKNPWSSEGCGRGESCFICRSKPGGCQKEGIVYSLTCQECLSKGILAQYHGESARSGWTRGLEHLSLLENEDDSSPLWKHCVEHHENIKVQFSMKVEKSHQSPMTRQIHESCAIEHSKSVILMNSKSEWGGQKIPRIVVQVQGKDQLEEEEIQVKKPKVKKKVSNNKRSQAQSCTRASKRARKEEKETDNLAPVSEGAEKADSPSDDVEKLELKQTKKRSRPSKVSCVVAKKELSRGKKQNLSSNASITKFFKIDARRREELDSSASLNLLGETDQICSTAAEPDELTAGVSSDRTQLNYTVSEE